MWRQWIPELLRRWHCIGSTAHNRSISDDLVGQEHVVQTLRNAIRLNRIGHAYLFCGPRGTGKTTTARLLAKAVNCQDPDPDVRPCGVCDACVSIARGSATDVIEIDAASNRGIDDIRELRERVKYAPAQLHTKFYIIDEAHQITGAAANAFLKTLEEPPAHTKFVLATTDPEELLATIVSRCQRFDFRRITLDAMIARLRTVADAEGLTVEPDAFPVIARHATGSLRDALGLLDQLAVYRDRAQTDGVITADLVRTLLGVSRNDRVETLVTAMADRDAALALGTVNGAVEAGEDPRQLNRQLVAYLRVLLHQRAGGSPDADAKAQELAARFDLQELADLARRFSETDYRIRHSPYGQLPLEIALVAGILRPDPNAIQAAAAPVAVAQAAASTQPSAPSRPSSPDLEPADRDLLAKPPSTALRDRIRMAPGNKPPAVAPSNGRSLREDPPAPSGSTAAPEAPPTASASAPVAANGGSQAGGNDLEHLVELWPRVCGDVKAVNRRIEALLKEADPVVVTTDLITIATAYDFHKSKLNADDVRPVIEDVLGRLLGRHVNVTCVLRTDVVASAPSRAAATISPAASPAIFDRATAETPATELAIQPDPEPVPGGETAPGERTEDDLRRIEAVKNIFDAEIISEP